MNAIVAVDKNFAIGKDNKMCWYIPDDFKHFKSTTNNSMVVMGRKTYESIGKSLPNRVNVILTRDSTFAPYSDGDIVVHSFSELDVVIEEYDGEVFCIGGGELYKKYIHHFEKIFITLVNKVTIEEPDTYFPRFLIEAYNEHKVRDTKMVDGVKDDGVLDENYSKNLVCSYHLFERNNFGIDESFIKRLLTKVITLGNPISINFLGEPIQINRDSLYLNLSSSFRPFRNFSETDDYILGFVKKEVDDDNFNMVTTLTTENSDGCESVMLNNRMVYMEVRLDINHNDYDKLSKQFIKSLYNLLFEIKTRLGENIS